MSDELVFCPKCGGSKFALHKRKNSKGELVGVFPECLLCKQADELSESKGVLV